MFDVCNGFWHVGLNEESTYLTTFQTPFGQYRWRRIPFSMSSSLELFQREMHEFIEGLSGIEVVVDDLIVVFGDSVEEATRDHHKNLM